MLEEKINELLEKRGNSEPVQRYTEGIEVQTSDKIVDIAKLRELFDTYSRVRTCLERIRSYGNTSLISEIHDYLKSFLKNDVEYQNFFKESLVSCDNFESYNSNFTVFYNAIRFLEDRRCLPELSQLLTFLKGLDSGDYRLLSDETLKKLFG